MVLVAVCATTWTPRRFHMRKLRNVVGKPLVQMFAEFKAFRQMLKSKRMLKLLVMLTRHVEQNTAARAF